MSDALIFEFNGVSVDDYNKVNDVLGFDPATGAGDQPAGLLSHTAASKDDALLVFEIWNSRAEQETFLATRLGPALGQVNVPPPSRMEWLTVVGRFTA